MIFDTTRFVKIDDEHGMLVNNRVSIYVESTHTAWEDDELDMIDDVVELINDKVKHVAKIRARSEKRKKLNQSRGPDVDK